MANDDGSENPPPDAGQGSGKPAEGEEPRPREGGAPIPIPEPQKPSSFSDQAAAAANRPKIDGELFLLHYLNEVDRFGPVEDKKDWSEVDDLKKWLVQVNAQAKADAIGGDISRWWIVLGLVVFVVCFVVFVMERGAATGPNSSVDHCSEPWERRWVVLALSALTGLVDVVGLSWFAIGSMKSNERREVEALSGALLGRMEERAREAGGPGP